MDDIWLSKKALRTHLHEILKDLPNTEFVRAGRLITSHVAKWLGDNSSYIKHHQVALFHDMRDEVSTEDLRTMLVEASIRTCYPDSKAKGLLHFYLREDGQSTEIPIDNLDMIFVPGRAFDLSGRRLGRGHGCYDRTLSLLKDKSPTPLFIGLALDSQIFDNVPTEPHDVLMHFVCTPFLGMLKTSE